MPVRSLVCLAFFVLTVMRLLALLKTMGDRDRQERLQDARLAEMLDVVAAFKAGGSAQEAKLADPSLDERLSGPVPMFSVPDLAAMRDFNEKLLPVLLVLSRVGWRLAVVMTAAVAAGATLGSAGGNLLQLLFGVLIAVSGIACMLFFQDDEEPSSLQSIRSWAVVPLIPPLIAVLLPSALLIAVMLIAIAVITVIFIK